MEGASDWNHWLLLAFLYTIRQRPPGHIGWFPFKEVGHNGLILVLFITVGKGVSALNDLWIEAENVVAGEDSGCSIGWTCEVCSAYASERGGLPYRKQRRADTSSGNRSQ